MEQAAVLSLIAAEIAQLGEFDNFHGITKVNAKSFLLEPYQVIVDPDDLETQPRDMWIVMREPRPDGFLIAFDSLLKMWSVVERVSEGAYVQVISGSSLEEALNGM